MKKIAFLFAALAAMASLSSCSDEIKANFEGEGRLILRPSISDDVKVKNRALSAEEQAELSNSCIIWISSSKGVVRKYYGIDQVPTEGIWLTGGSYVAEAWAGDSVPASFDKRYFKGREPFTISADQAAQVNLVCKIANVVTSVVYEDGVKAVLKDYSLTIGHSRGSLTFEGDDSRKGYFMMPSTDTDLTWTLNATSITGEAFTSTGKIADVEPTTEYVLRVRYNKEEEDLGGGLITIVVEADPIEGDEDDISLTAAPIIRGVNYDLSQRQIAESGNVGRKSVFVTSVGRLTSVVVECDEFDELLSIGGSDFDLLAASTSFVNDLRSKGINFTSEYDVALDASWLKVNFEAELMNLFDGGSHAITITATDSYGKTSTATLDLFLSSDPVTMDELPATAAYANKMVLTGTILRDDAESYGFNYREKGTSEWNFVPGTPVAARAGVTRGTLFTATITGLKPATTYEYHVAATGLENIVVREITTEAAQQVPNGGFELWSTGSDGAIMLGASASDYAWDTGNHGSITMNKNVTVSDTSVKHSGSYSAKLCSQFVGVGIIGKFAAGNAFLGQYLYTDGTDGVLGWGRPFQSRPAKLRGWVRYEPEAVTHASNSFPDLKKGDMDQGIIYVALLDETTEHFSAGDVDADFPVIIKTKSSERKLFDQNAKNVIAYGQMIFTERTEGSGMVEFEIPLDYVRDAKVSNLMIVCAASRGGDYFAGGPSVMYIDDFEFVYE